MRLEIILSSVAAVVSAQGVTQYLAPKGKSPKGCEVEMPGKYELSVAPIAKKQKRMAFEVGKTLQVTLSGGVLTDGLARVGYIADNYQFQFDGPPQAGSIYTGGWSLCKNGSLALGPSTVFYQCLSGSFYNLYDRWWAQQCSPINIVAHSLPEGAAAAPASAPLTPDPLQSGSADAPAGLASPSSPAKATSDTVSSMASVTLTSGAAPGAATTGLGSPASSLSSLDSSISSASSVSSSVISSASSSLASVSSSIKSSASSAKSSASASASAANNGVQVGGTGASTVALLMGVIGMVLA